MGFKEYYRKFKAYTDIDSKEYQRRLEELEPHLLRFLKEKGKVLDLACGVGGFSFLLEEYGFEVVGIDIDDEMIKKAREYAKEKNSKVEFIVGDARKLPFEDETFDYILLLGNTILHFSPRELSEVFKEVKRVLKKDGLLLINFIDMRELLSRVQMGTVVGEEYWISSVMIDDEEKSAVIEYKSEKNSFRIKLTVWGKTAVELLAKLYFTPIESVKLGEMSYLNVYKK
ncbi:class I SAM-dependent methyltransferase [Thermococcus bergensis]|uniref:class I SAM-dependent methyltransferase n=1 Tax=Thermococcus bergensis TaxID=2689387 RepID=UPI001CEDD951|nr:class I SAM-dependent methyltransferase [Thermococcus bergensis]MCA6213398.1 class I SAM-dependent methyltransferase [Thermococcus bergensis]